MDALIIAIGDELANGVTVDTNSAYLARALAERGIPTTAHWTVRDEQPAIAEAIRRAADAAGLVLITGGLGPTADDLTRQALAEAMDVELVLDRRCLADLEEFFSRRSREMIPANRVQAMLPRGAEPLANALGTAPGIAARLGRADIFVMPGVPEEMREMYRQTVLPRLPDGEGVIVHRLLPTFGAGESDIAAQITDLMARGRNPAVGTTASAGVVTVRIVARGATGPEAETLTAQTADEIRRRLGELVVGQGSATLGEAVGLLLRQRGETLTTAESCTGGLIGEMITDIPGASEYYRGGVVAYSNELKRQLLGVPKELLAGHGAVSEPVAAAMAEGCRQGLGVDWAVSVTGIAGPSGGSEAKPVGLVYCGLSGPGGTSVTRHVFPGRRDTIRRRSALTALNGLRLALMHATG